MNELAQIIPINTENPERITVFARDLHAFLEVDTPYRIWFPRMCEYGFEPGRDFNPYKKVQVQIEGGREVKRSFDDAELTIDMAKEICMLQRNEKGKIARRYFVELEKAWNSPEKVMARALQIANAQVKQLQAKIEADAPAVFFAEAVTGADTNILVRELAKVLSQNGYEVGGNRLYEQLRQEGYLIKNRGTDYNMPTQKAMELGLFFVRETPRVGKTGTVLDKVVRVTPRGQKYFINRYAPKKALLEN